MGFVHNRRLLRLSCIQDHINSLLHPAKHNPASRSHIICCNTVEYYITIVSRPVLNFWAFHLNEIAFNQHSFQFRVFTPNFGINEVTLPATIFLFAECFDVKNKNRSSTKYFLFSITCQCS